MEFLAKGHLASVNPKDGTMVYKSKPKKYSIELMKRLYPAWRSRFYLHILRVSGGSQRKRNYHEHIS